MSELKLRPPITFAIRAKGRTAMSRDYSKISLTAKLTAYMRQFTDIPFAKDVAELVGAREAFEQLLHGRDILSDDLLWYAPILEARYKSVGELIKRSGAQQILDIASGLTLRGLAATEDESVTYLESDLGEITREKIQLIGEIARRHRLPGRPNLHIAAADALRLDSLLNAIQGKFLTGVPIAVVQEGLLPYLTSEEAEKVAGNIRALLEKFGGVWITTDFTLKSDAAPISEQQRKFREIVSAATDAKMYNNSFDNDEQLHSYFARLGFDIEVHNQLDLAPDLYSANLITSSQLDELKPRLRVWVLHLATNPPLIN
jgi:O-methyltransferase involved in polyketide biosynthesis